MLNLVSIDRGKQTSIFIIFIISQGVRRTKSAPVRMYRKKQITSTVDNEDLRRTKSTSLCTEHKIE